MALEETSAAAGGTGDTAREVKIVRDATWFQLFNPKLFSYFATTTIFFVSVKLVVSSV